MSSALRNDFFLMWGIGALMGGGGRVWGLADGNELPLSS